jgi:hypothetical protein
MSLAHTRTSTPQSYLSYNIGAEGSTITLELYEKANGWHAIVSGSGEMMNFTAGNTARKLYTIGKDFGIAVCYPDPVDAYEAIKNRDIDKVPFYVTQRYLPLDDNRPYLDMLEKITSMEIRSGIRTIGAYFMHRAYHLTNLVFENSEEITHIGD